MKPLTANLKHLYQNRVLCFSHLIFLLAVFIMPVKTYNIYAASTSSVWISLGLICFYGMILGFITANTFSKPLVFSLPCHAKTSQKTILLTWILITVIYILLKAPFVHDFKNDWPLFLCTAGLVSVSYWLGVSLVIREWISIVLFFLMFLGLITDSEMIVDSILMAHPVAVTIASSILICFIYNVLGRKNIIRYFCNSPWKVGVSVKSGELSNMKRFNGKEKSICLAEPLNRFFVRRIRSSNTSMFSANLWGYVYLITSTITQHFRLIVIFSIGIFVYEWLDIRKGDLDFLELEIKSLGLMIVYYSLIFNLPKFRIFQLAGRKIHFWNGIVRLIVFIIFFLCLMSVYIFLFNIIFRDLLPVIYGELSFVIPPVRWLLFLIPIIMIPFLGGLVILFKKINLLFQMLIVVFIGYSMVFIAAKIIIDGHFDVNWPIILTVMAIAWGFHLAVLYYDSMKRPLC